MVTRIDARQSRQRALLDQLSLNTDVKLDTLLNLINDELQPLLRLRQANPSSLVLNVDAISVTTSDSSEGHGRTKTIQPISGVLPSFTPGSITFPGTSGGSISASGLTLATSYTLTVGVGQWIKVLLALNTDGQIVLSFGTTGASESAAGFPDIDTGVLPIGYVSMQNIGGTIQNVTGARIYQFTGGGGAGGGSGSGTFTNYLNKWFDGESNITGVNNGGVSDTGNRSATDAVWASTNTGFINVARTSSSPLRGKNSILVTMSGGSSAAGATFIETPVFVLQQPDFITPNMNLYVSFSYGTPVVNQYDIVLVRYNSAGTFQEKIPVVGAHTLSGAAPASQLVGSADSVRRFFGYASKNGGGAIANDDKFALRIRGLAGTDSLRIEDLYVGPNADVGSGAQRYAGTKQFADEVELREGMNVPLNLDFVGTLSVPANETKMVGKLDVASGTTIDVASGANLVTVGSITGPGSLTGSGTITSI